MSKKIMVIAGEASGDLHGARLVAAIKAKHPNYIFYGMGGQELRAQGVEILFDAAKIAVVGIIEVITHLKDILCAQKVLRQKMQSSRPDLLIIIDFPDFNLLLAKKAKKHNIPVFYYITPQVWAWRKGRVKTIQKVVDRIGVILPFEKKFFQDHGLQADYVGHPLLDSVKLEMDRNHFCERYNVDQEKIIVGLLPGSRKKEIVSLLPIFLEGAKRLTQKSDKEMVFLIPLANTLTLSDLKENGLDQYDTQINVKVIQDNRYELMASCSAVVAASGTVALELALLDIPMVIVYKLSPITYRLGKLLVKLDNFSLVNLIAKKQIVPELLQDEVNATQIEKELSLLLFNPSVREKMIDGLSDVRKKLGKAGASQQAAELAQKMLIQNKSCLIDG